MRGARARGRDGASAQACPRRGHDGMGKRGRGEFDEGGIMKTISRRKFLGTSAMGIAGAAYLARAGAKLRANPLGMPIGVQTWEVRDTIGKDFDGTLHKLSADGFQAIEMCSPPGYKMFGFGALASMKPSEMRERIHSAGLTCISCHFGFPELKNSLDERIEFAKGLGLEQMIISTFWLPKNATLDDWKRAADAANKIGEQTKKAGIQLGFHNHDFEFQKINGELIYPHLMSELDPSVVKMQFQVQVIQLGYKAADYFEKYPGRFISTHLSDWSAATPEGKEVPLGQGVVDWKKTFEAAKVGGIKNYFVEMSLDNMKASVPYLRTLS
jgi:sugar phosphate isomerase/epimerase